MRVSEDDSTIYIEPRTTNANACVRASAVSSHSLWRLMHILVTPDSPGQQQ